jgi:methanogenic corrinoid protein MtbC1
MDDRSLLDALTAAVMEGSEDDAADLCRKALESGVEPGVIVQEGLSRGMQEVGTLFESGELFVPELLIAAAAMEAGISVLFPSTARGADAGGKETVVIGVVEGDVHEIGKNLVKVMLEADGYRLIDLGHNVEPHVFLENLKDSSARVLALSTMMTTTLPNMRRTVELALEMEPRPVIVLGGAPMSAELAVDMGADGFAPDAAKAPGLLRSILRPAAPGPE